MSKGPSHRIPNKRVRSRDNASREQAYLESSWGATAGLQHDFVIESDPAKKSKIVEKMLGAKQVKDLFVIGAMCIEMARDDTDEAGSWFDRADGVLREAVQSCALSGLKRSADQARAQRLLDSMPHYYGAILSGQLPSSEWNAKMYNDVLATAQGTLGSYGQVVRNRRRDSSTDDSVSLRPIRELTGELAEQSVHLLALRAAGAIGPEMWSPVPSYFSQDHQAQTSKSYLQRSWDLTIQTRADCGPIEDTYLVQVKSSEYEGEKHRKYTDDVSVVRFDPDLALDGESLRMVKLIKEMVWEQQGDTRSSSGRQTISVTRTSRLNQP